MSGPTRGPLSVTVLGSGSPYTTRSRVSAGYLIRVGGTPRILVDAGGGVFERMGRIGADPAELDAVVLTHTHIDHSGGLAPVVFAAFMQGRDRPLPVVGPSGKDGQPGCRRFCDLLFGPSGAWSYLHSFDGFGIDAHEARHDSDRPQPLERAVTHDDLQVTTVGVDHAMMPTVAYRFDLEGHSIVVSGDLEGASERLVELARGCDILVHDQALPRRDMPHGHLHPPPAETARNAAGSGAATLLLSHLMPPADEQRKAIVEEIASAYSGRIEVASDLLTIVAG